MARLNDVPDETKSKYLVHRRGIVETTARNGTLYFRKWPRKRGPAKSIFQQAWIDLFREIVEMQKTRDPRDIEFAKEMAVGTGYTWRDVLARASQGLLLRDDHEEHLTAPTASVRNTAGESLTQNIQKVLTPTVQDWDVGAFWSPTTNPTRLTFQSPGFYLLLGAVRFLSANAGNSSANFFKNGTTQLHAISGSKIANLACVIPLMYFTHFSRGDYVEIRGFSSQTNTTAQLDNFTVIGLMPQNVTG